VHIPLSNEPLKIVTPPGAPRKSFDGDGFLVEYLLAYPVYIADNNDWPPIRYMSGDRPLEIQKPISISTPPWQPDDRLGNESPDVHCTIVRVASSIVSGGQPASPTDIWLVVELLVTWVSVKARHYWMLHGGDGVRALFRG